MWVDEQTVHGQSIDYRDFWVWFIREYNVSLVADTFGVILIVRLSERLAEQGSVEYTHDQSPAQKPG